MCQRTASSGPRALHPSWSTYRVHCDYKVQYRHTGTNTALVYRQQPKLTAGPSTFLNLMLQNEDWGGGGQGDGGSFPQKSSEVTSGRPALGAMGCVCILLGSLPLFYLPVLWQCHHRIYLVGDDFYFYFYFFISNISFIFYLVNSIPCFSTCFF